jgi:hypothetical protein
VASGDNVITWKMKIEEFLNIVNISETRIYLRSPQNIADIYNKQKNNSNEEDRWTDEKLSNFKSFGSAVRGISYGKYKDINEGNILEAFLRHLQEGRGLGGDDYWHLVHRSVKETLLAPLAYYQGGDINNEQIKGLKASVTNINSLILTF